MIRRILTALIEPIIADRIDHATQVSEQASGAVIDRLDKRLKDIRTALGRHAHPQFSTAENVRGLVVAYEGEREQTSLAHQAAGEVSAEMGAEIQRLKAKLDEVESALLPWRGNIIPSLAEAVRDLVKEWQNYAKAVNELAAERDTATEAAKAHRRELYDLAPLMDRLLAIHKCNDVSTAVQRAETDKSAARAHARELVDVRTALKPWTDGHQNHDNASTVVAELVADWTGQEATLESRLGRSRELVAELDDARARLANAEAMFDNLTKDLTAALAGHSNPFATIRQNVAALVDAYDKSADARQKLFAELKATKAQLATERNCGQDDVCATAPGCARHWQERARQLVGERDAIAAKLRDASTEAERLAAKLEDREDDHLTLLAIREKLTDYVVKNRLGGQKLQVVVDHVLADARAFRALVTEPTTTLANANASAIATVDRGLDLRAAGWHCSPDAGWTKGLDGEYMSTADAHARMLADKAEAKDNRCKVCGWPIKATIDEGCTAESCSYRPEPGSDEHARLLANRAEATPRDTMTQPEPGDMYIDKERDIWCCSETDKPPQWMAEEKRFLYYATPNGIIELTATLRPARPEEAAKIRKDNGLDAPLPTTAAHKHCGGDECKKTYGPGGEVCACHCRPCIDADEHRIYAHGPNRAATP